MKRIRRFLAILLCVCLVAAPMCSALAEDGVLAVSEGETTPIETGTDGSEDVSEPETPPAETGPTEDEVVPGGTDETAPGNGTTPSGDVETPPESETTSPDGGVVDPNAPGNSEGEGDVVIESGEGDSTGNPPAETDPEPSDAPEDTGETEDPTAIDYTQSAAASPAFCQGYAELKPDTTAYAESGIDAQVLGTIGGGAVYVLGRVTSERADRLNVAFDWEGVRYAWIDADRARPMTPDEISSFIIDCSTRENVCTLPDHPELLLDKLECALAAANGAGDVPQDEPETVDAPAEIQVPEAKLVVPQESFTLGVGETRAIGASFDDGESYGIQYSVEGEDIVSVSQDGVITALAAGEATVKLHCDFDDAQVHVTVKAAPTGVTLSAPRTVLAAGEQVALEAALPEGEEFELTFSTSNPAVALPNEKGVVTTIAPGTAVITAKTYNDLSASVTLTVLPALQDIALNLTELTLGVGQTAQLLVTLTPADAANFYTFKVEPEGVVQFDPQTGRIEALTPGTATVAVETYNQKTASCKVTVNYAPKEVSFAEAEIVIGVNESANIPLIFTAPEGAPEGAACTTNCTYATTKASVASVDGAGSIRGRKTGTAYITATTDNNLTATLKVTVMKAPTKVKLYAASQILGVKDHAQLWASFSSKAWSRTLYYSSSDSGVLAVDEAGYLTAIAVGNATITVSTYNGKSASLNFSVVDGPETIALNVPEETLGVGQQSAVTATLPAGTAGTYTFESDRPDIVEVNESSGALTAKAVGTANITVTAYNGTSASAAIRVVGAPDAIELAETYIYMGVGEWSAFPKITAGREDKADCHAAYSFWSSKPKVATVYADGTLWARKAGTAVITVMTHNQKYATLTVKVQKAPKRVYLSAARTTLGQRETMQLGTWLNSGAVSRAITFASSDESVATVDASGLVTATDKKGSTVITATAFNGKYASLVFTVVDEPGSIALNLPQDGEVAVGQTVSVTATLPEGTAGSYTFQSGSPSIVDVDENSGALTVKAMGTADITVTAYNGKSEKKTITVVPAPENISLAETYIEMGTGEWAAFPKITIDDGTRATFYFSSSKSKVVTVYEDGTLWARKTGTAVITVWTHNQKYAAVTVRVRKAPKKVYIGAPYAQMGLDQEMQAWAWPNSGTVSRGYTYYSSDENVLKVLDPATGKVKAVGKGSATLSVCTFNNKWASMGITVLDKPTKIALNLPQDGEIAVGQTVSATATLPEGTAGSYTFQSGSPGIVDVDENSGALTAKAEGTADITVTTYNGVYKTETIKVVPAPESITLAEEYIEMGAGEWAAFPKITIDKGTRASYSFWSSKPKVVTVYEDGSLWARKAGTAVITVMTHNQKYAYLTVKVYKAPKKVYIGAPYAQMGLNQEMTAWAWPNSGAVSRGYTYYSSDENVLKVLDPATGKVKAVGKGNATLSVCTFNNKWASMSIAVVDAPSGITLNLPQDGEVAVEQPVSVTATLPEGSAGSYTFQSDRPDVVDVDENTGALTAKAKGTANITVTTYNQKTDTKSITVVPAPEKIELAETYIEMGTGEWAAFPQITIDKGARASYSFWSSKPKVVTVYEDGTLWARKTGTAVITVMTHNQKYAYLTVKVCKAPKKVYIGAHHTTLGVGEKTQAWAWVSSGAVSRALTYTSNDEAVLRVTNAATGEFEAVGTGSAAITVATYNGKYASLWFTVLEAPKSVALTPKPLTLGAGEWYTVGSTTQPENSGGGRTYSIDAGGESVATIDPTTGAIHALATGTATVRVTMYNDLCTDAFALTVKPAPTGIQLNNSDIVLSVGDGFQIPRPTPLGEDVHSETFAYWSSKTKYVTVNAAGWVYAKSKGSAKVTVSTYNGKTATFTVTVKAAPKSIGFGEAEHRLFMDRKYTPLVWFANGVPGNYTITSTDESVVRVCEDGKTVESLKPGTVTLTAVSYNNKYAWMQIWVPELPEWVKLDPATLTLGRGDSATVRAVVPEGAGAEMTFTSDNTGVASFESVDNETITVTAAGVGDTVIHVKSQNGKESAASIKVLEAPTALSMSPSSAERSIEEKSLQLSWGFGAAGEGGHVEFASSNPAVATVNGSGLVTFVGIGTARITARTYNGHEAACELRVGEKPGKMFFEQETYQVALNDSVRIPASFDKGCVSYALQAGEGGVVEIKGDVVHALKKGKVKLTAHSNMYGLTAECTVEVVDAPNGIKADIEDVIELVVGISSTQQLNAIPLLNGEPSVGTVHYATSDPQVAVVDYDTGLVTPKGKGADGKGECTITATTYNGFQATYQVKVSYLLEGARIGLDPGHQAKGNMDKERMSPNSKSTKYKCAYSSSGVAHVSEHIINLQVGLQLRDALQKLGAEVYMTRETADVDISNKQRAEMMNDLGVDFVLRLHCNAASTSSAQGLSIIRRKSWAYSGSVTVNGKELTGSWVKSEENRLGRCLATPYINATGCKWRGLGTSDEYTMNNWSKVPCLLVELGFMTHPTEGKKLVQADYQQKMVMGLVNGICEYYYVPHPTEW